MMTMTTVKKDPASFALTPQVPDQRRVCLRGSSLRFCFTIKRSRALHRRQRRNESAVHSLPLVIELIQSIDMKPSIRVIPIGRMTRNKPALRRSLPALSGISVTGKTLIICKTMTIPGKDHQPLKPRHSE